MKDAFQIPSPVEVVAFAPFTAAGIAVHVKRDDKIHPAISGNKWRKLKYNIAAIQQAGAPGFITFGGAFSNHLAACAFVANSHNLHMIALVRGLEQGITNPTLNFLQQCGVTVIGITRSDYNLKSEPEFLETIQQTYPGYVIIPEGGANLPGIKGCMEILHEVPETFDYVAAPVGTATTFTGLLLSGYPAKKFLGFPAVRGGAYLEYDVNNFIAQAKHTDWLPTTFTPPAWRLVTDYHFGGFGKVTPELIAFMNRFYAEADIPLDPVYTAKMVFGLTQMAANGAFEKGSSVLVVHTGGLQGIIGMNQRLRKKNLRIDYEEAIAHPFPAPPH